MAREKTNAQKLKITLKQEFPGIKFSCRQDGWSSVSVEWFDGPTKEQVEKFALEYESISRCQHTGDILSGGNSFVHVKRKYTLEKYVPVAEALAKKIQCCSA